MPQSHKPHNRKVEGIFAVLRIRERELLKLQGPCSNKDCRLHKAHEGPCDERKKRVESGGETEKAKT